MGRPADRDGRPGRQARPSPVRAQRRPAAARRGGARARLAPGRDLRRRADRQPRLDVLARGARAAAPRRRRVRPDGRDGHARRRRREDRRRDDRDGRRADRRMTRVVLRGLLARRLRLALTAFAVALGVTLVSGTYVFTDTINASFDTIFTKAYDKTDVVVSPGDAVSGQDDNKTPMPAAGPPKVKAPDGIANAEGGTFALR